MDIKSHIISLKSRYPFRITHGVRTETSTFIVELHDGSLTGYGEATPVPYYGITPEGMNVLMEAHREAIETAPWDHPAQLWEHLRPLIGHNHFLQCAIDIAAYDLWAKRHGKTVYQMLGLDISRIPCSDYTIGMDEIPEMIRKMKEFDFPIYKIKLGTDHDIAIVEALRKETDAVFRVDANTAWTVEQTIDFSGKMKALGVEFIEQPLKPGDYEGMKEVMAHTALPVIADESCITEEDVQKCVGAFSGINIKLAKCGGITPGLRMIAEARAHNMQLMMGCMTESSIGISAIAQLLPLLDYVDMDGILLIANDPADGVYLEKGRAVFPDRPGIGAFLKI
ncbi:dipeptide epimerase [Leadbetterella sp. DM7]|uniref:dipeptide epimerase n=1 Tax=Leadbetterella sp. DM7 TaxID=3235085 RepID=UPI00349EC180